MMLTRTSRSLVALVMLSASAGWANAQPDEQPLDLTCPTTEGAGSPLTMGRRLIGTQCGNCHSRGAIASDWILSNEFQVWEDNDRHSKAYLTLLGSRAQAMGDLLRVEEIASDARCLACHATLPAEWMTGDSSPVASILASEAAHDLVAGGITCEGCHGAAGDADGVTGWQTHAFDREWRNRSPEEKQSKFGYYNVRSPASRTRMCASCHVGDPERGRLVTHEMYAAGHPPLPSFEVETFLRDMPPHWRRISTSGKNPRDYVEPKSNEASRRFLDRTQEAYYAQLRGQNPQLFDQLKQDTSTSFERARSIAIGAIATWTQNARVTAALASEASYPLIPTEHRWPELAAFECAACHHDLKLSGWRALREPPSTPGRPMLRNWSSPLTKAVLLALEEEQAVAAINAAESFMQAATSEQPYGNQQAIAVRLSQAASLADELASTIENRVFSERDAKRLLARIAQVGEQALMDYESARQLVWAADSVLRELDPKGTWNDSAAALANAKLQLTTDLAVPMKSAERLQPQGGAVRQVKLVDLPAVLKPSAEYDAGAMQRCFSRLLDALKKEL
ncbi:MAG: hypothetical protein KDA37_06480 [Planctomycetales bacterium]|nr:hypothetical protein [Planctomycetales bacterium]